MKKQIPIYSITEKNCLRLKKLKLPPPNQVGIIVTDLARGAYFYGSLLNIKRWYKTRIVDAECFYRGNAIKQTLQIAVGYAGGIQYELILQSSSEENIYNSIYSEDKGGFHHLGSVVGDIDRRLSVLEEAGIKPLQTGTIRFGRAGVTRYAYLDTMELAGFILELIETRAFGINMGMPEMLPRLGLLTGDTETLKIQAGE